MKNDTNSPCVDVNDILYSITQKNLVYNYNFMYFSNKAVSSSGTVEYKHPDGWIYSDSGSSGEIGLEGDRCRILKSNDDTSLMTLKQNLNEFPRWETVLQGESVSAKGTMSISDKCQVTVTISDCITSNEQSFYLDAGGEVEFDLGIDVDITAKNLFIQVSSSSKSAIIKISSIYANIGKVAIENLPCIVNGVIGERKQYIATENSPAEEISLCADAKPVLANQTRLNSVLNYRFGKSDQGYSLLPDVRGYFSRAWNNSASIDKDPSSREMLGDKAVKGDFVGTQEEDIFTEHDHKIDYSTVPISQGPGAAGTGLNLTVSSNTAKNGGGETRPVNIAELYTIKWA